MAGIYVRGLLGTGGFRFCRYGDVGRGGKAVGLSRQVR